MNKIGKRVLGLGLAGVLGISGFGVGDLVGATKVDVKPNPQSTVNPSTRPRDTKLEYGDQLVIPNYVLSSSSVTVGETESYFPFGGNVIAGTLDVQIKAGPDSNPNSIVINNLNDYSNRPLEIRTTIPGTYYIRIKHDATGQLPKCNGKPVEWITLVVKKQPTSIKFGSKSYKVNVGKTFIPKVVFNDGEGTGNVSFSFNEKYLSYSNGKFKGLEAGKTTLTVITGNGVKESVSVVVKKTTKNSTKKSSTKKSSTKKSSTKKTTSKKTSKKTTKK